MSSLRQRKSALKVVKEFDAFPKIPEGYKETTASGGGVSIAVFVIIGILVVTEVNYYSARDLKFEYQVDQVMDGKLQINIDLTVAMKCEWIGADVLDLTGQRAETFGALKEEAVYYELSPAQRQHFEMNQNLNEYIREEYHAIHKLLWRSGYMSRNNELPAREDQRTDAKDGCRLYGTLSVNKVAGNFHITAGKSVPVFPKGHAHLAMMVKENDYNFSHRIDHFSFGENTPGIISPMDSEQKIAPKNHHMFQYFIQVVPTEVDTFQSSVDTYQFAYTEKDRTISHSEGSHGVPGIFVKYDLSPLKVIIREVHKPYWQFLVRLCGIVGGIFATSGMLHSLIGFLTDVFCCRFRLGKYQGDGLLGVTGKAEEVKPSNPPSTPSTEYLPGTSLVTDSVTAAQNPLLNQLS